MDRFHAGSELARRLEKEYAERDDALVLGLTPGGVPVAFQIAEELGLPMDVFVVRKLGVPGREELAMGAIATGGIRIINRDLIRRLSIPDDDIARVATQEQEVLEARERSYRKDRSSPVLQGKTVLVVDDGAVTGASMKAAIEAVREQEPRWIVAAVPVASPAVCGELEEMADEMACLRTPGSLEDVASWYQDFRETPAPEIQELLSRATTP